MAPYRLLVVAAATIALAAASALPATAGAAGRAVESRSATSTHGSGPLKAAVAVAQRYWGAVPCAGAVKVIARQDLTTGLAPTADAWVTFDSSLGANNLAAPPSSYTNCTIAFGRTPWPTAASMRADWNMFCTTMTHELGHLLGHDHDMTPGSVMAPVFNDRSSVTQSCRASRPARSHR
jgi:Matrixin